MNATIRKVAVARFPALVGMGKLALFVLICTCAAAPPHKSVQFAMLSLPAGLSATAPAGLHYSVTLTWDRSPSPEAIGYRIYYGIAPRTYTNRVEVGNGTTGMVTRLEYGPVYYFTATAFDLVGSESDYCNEVTWTNTSTPVTTISVLQAPTLDGPWTAFTNWPAIKMTNLPAMQFWKLSISHALE